MRVQAPERRVGTAAGTLAARTFSPTAQVVALMSIGLILAPRDLD
jgi:hypothetical protein